MAQQIEGSPAGELEQAVAAALQQARALGASQAEADVSVHRGLSATVRLGEVDTIEYHRDRGLGVTVYFGQRKGSASTADLAAEAVRRTVEKAVSIARHTAADECAGLADADMLAREIPDLDLSHPWELQAEQAVALARECEAAGLAVDRRLGNSEGATVSTHASRRVYGNSLGFLAGYPSTSHAISCVLIARDGDDMQRDYWHSVARASDELEPVAAIGRRAAERAVRRLGARRVPTCQARVLFAPELARGLFGHLVAAIRGTSQYRRASFLLDAVGEQVLPASVQIIERPHIRRGLASSPFDAEGVATRDSDLVRDGVLCRYVLGSYSARKLGLKSTGNADGIHNLLVSAGAGETFEQLLTRMHRGLFVTELMGQGINIVTGDYSRGASGFWVENGAIAYPVHEITIAGNLRDMFGQVLAVGSDVDALGAIRVGSVLLEQMTIAGE